MARRRRNRQQPEMVAADETAMLEGAGSYGGEDASEGISVAAGDGSTAKPLTEQEFSGRVRMAVASAERFVDDHITPARVEAAKFYRGAAFGDEEEGRSQVVLSEVRDTIQAMMPSLMRIFTSGQKIVEYMPRTADDVNLAEQASDAVNFIFNEMNPGFQILHSAFKDALLKRAGIVTWWAENEDRVVEKHFSGMTEDEVLLFRQNNPTAEFTYIYPEAPSNPMEPVTYKFCVKVVDRQVKYRIRSLPPECFIIDKRARDTDRTFDIIGYRDLVPISDLVEMGFDEDEIREHGAPGDDDLWVAEMEEQERNPGYLTPYDDEEPTLQRVKYLKVYLRIDKDGDGIAELRCIHAVGDTCYILKDEVVDHAPFALFCPDPEPHTVFGHSIADVTMDLQRIKSHVLRATLDSLAQSIFPRTVIVEGQVNIDDVLNKEVGAVVRARTPGAVQDLSTPFVGQAAMPILDYLDQIKAQRTGITPTSQGLDADVLQSTTRAAVNAQISASQDRIELIARTFAETGMRQLFAGLLKLITRHQDKPLLIRLRGQWVPMDVSQWDANMDCVVSVALGRGDDAQQMGFLTQVAQKQEQILQTMGLGNPLVKPSQYANTLSQIVRKAGFKNPESFFSPISPDQDAAIAQMAQSSQGQAKDPNQLLAEVELAKAQAETFARLQSQALDRAKLQLDADLKRDEMEANIILKAAEIAAKGGQPVDWAAIIQMTQRPRTDIQQLAQALIDQEKLASAQVLSQIGMQSAQPPAPPPQQPAPAQQMPAAAGRA